MLNVTGARLHGPYTANRHNFANWEQAMFKQFCECPQSYQAALVGYFHVATVVCGVAIPLGHTSMHTISDTGAGVSGSCNPTDQNHQV